MAIVVGQRAELADAPRRRAGRAWLGGLVPWAVPALLLILWQVAIQAGLLPQRILPAPLDVLRTTARMLLSEGLLADIGVSARRALGGLLLGGGIGFALGLANGMFPLSERLFDTTVQMLRTIPNLALLPLVILWFGIGEGARLTLISLGVFFPVYLNTYHGVRTADPGLKEMGAVYGLSAWGQFRHIVLPGALPSILIGLRFALGVMWLTLIVAESLASNQGIGHITMDAREFMQTDVLVMGIVIYALLGKLADSLARLLERRLLRWRPS
ncbi:MAG TPA: ABC transporter permease subunit [Herpetosiphonaceae bacterium]